MMKVGVTTVFVMSVLALSLRPRSATGLPQTGVARPQTAVELSSAGVAPPPAVAESALASDTITLLPGDARLDVDRWLPRRVTWRVTIVGDDGSRTVQGLWTDMWARAEEDGRPTMVFRTLFVDTLGAVIQDNETVFDAESYRTLRARQAAPGRGSVSYRYSGDSVSGTVRPQDAEPRPFTVVFDEPVWDPLFPGLGLVPAERVEPGLVVRYPIWNQTGPGGDVTWRTERVDSVARARAADGSTARAWHITRTTASAPNVGFRYLWTPGPPYAWWLRVERPGLTREWEVVDWEPFVR